MVVPVRGSRDRVMIPLAAALTAVVFAIDVTQPLGNVIGMLYVLIVLLGLWVDHPPYPLYAAALATSLIAGDLAVGWEPQVPNYVFINRPLMAALYWTTAAVVVSYKGLQRRAQRQVKELADLKYALDQAAIVATTDVRGRITYVNDKFCEISKYPAEELLGQDHRLINSGLHPKPFFQQLWYTIASGRVWHGEIRNRAKDGAHYWVDTTIVPFVDGRGKPYQYTAIRSDITERKLAEERLREQASLAHVGQLAAVVAHEVKNPLAGIRGAMQVMLTRRDAGDPEAAVMREIIERVDSLSALIHDLLIFARPRTPRFAPVELRPLLLDAAAGLRRDPAGQQVTVDITGPDLALTADNELLSAAFLNLFLNAAQAMQGRGTIRVALVPAGDKVRVDVRDEGPGIPAGQREKVFEPFFTTKARGGGLGLPIVRRTTELHGGTVSVDAAPGGGTIVSVRLPWKAASTRAPVTEMAGASAVINPS